MPGRNVAYYPRCPECLRKIHVLRGVVGVTGYPWACSNHAGGMSRVYFRVWRGRSISAHGRSCPSDIRQW